GQSLQRHPGPLQALQPPRPEGVTRREPPADRGRQDPQLDQPVDIVRADPGPLGDLLAGISAHTTASITSPDKHTSRVERVTGIEPASRAWKARALPLSY